MECGSMRNHSKLNRKYTPVSTLRDAALSRPTQNKQENEKEKKKKRKRKEKEKNKTRKRKIVTCMNSEHFILHTHTYGQYIQYIPRHPSLTYIHIDRYIDT